MALAYFLMEVMEVAVTVFHCPLMLPICHFNDINLKHILSWIKKCWIKAASHSDGWSIPGRHRQSPYSTYFYPTKCDKTEINRTNKSFVFAEVFRPDTTL